MKAIYRILAPNQLMNSLVWLAKRDLSDVEGEPSLLVYADLIHGSGQYCSELDSKFELIKSTNGDLFKYYQLLNKVIPVTPERADEFTAHVDNGFYVVSPKGYHFRVVGELNLHLLLVNGCVMFANESQMVDYLCFFESKQVDEIVGNTYEIVVKDSVARLTDERGIEAVLDGDVESFIIGFVI